MDLSVAQPILAYPHTNEALAAGLRHELTEESQASDPETIIQPSVDEILIAQVCCFLYELLTIEWLPFLAEPAGVPASRQRV